MSIETLESLNNWALGQIKDFIPNHNESLERTFIESVKNAFLNGWSAAGDNYLKISQLQNKAIIYFAIRTHIGEENEQEWLSYIKRFIEANSEND